MNEEGEKKNKLRDSHTNTSPGSKPSYLLLDPNPSLIDANGNLIDNINLAASLATYRNGTIADGVSKLLIRIPYYSKLQFAIKDRASNDLSDGRLSSLILGSLGQPMLSSSSVSVDPQIPTNGNPVVIAVYTPPDSFNQHMGSNKTIKVNVSDLDNSVKTVFEIPILLYRPPVVLVHGVWVNSDTTWVETSFDKCLTKNGFYYAFADYEAHNSETFDPCDKVFGNYGIDSIRNTIRKTLQDYHHFSIAASQVDIVAHSMGGLMARGFVQQPDYKANGNYMKGSIHRLITIGTPHFGGPLSRILYDHSDYWYFFTEDGKPNRCRTGKVEPMKLRTMCSILNIHIDKGAIEALIPNSIAYSHLHQTNVKSYAIAGSYKPNATMSHDSQESYYKAVEDSDDFNLDRDAFDDCDNDLLVSITSQLGGLTKHHSAIYCNTVHEGFYIKDDSEAGISSETNSTHIQDDVVRLLSFSDSNKFADVIGRDSSNGSLDRNDR